MVTPNLRILGVVQAIYTSGIKAHLNHVGDARHRMAQAAYTSVNGLYHNSFQGIQQCSPEGN